MHSIGRYGAELLTRPLFRTVMHPNLYDAATPNPSVEARPNGRPPGPVRRYAVHFRRPGPGVLPLVPPHLER